MSRLSLTARVAVTLAAALALVACQTTPQTQRRTAAGALVGAVAGAGVAHATKGDPVKGAVIGAAVGGVGTYLWSQNMERQHRELQASLRGQPVTISRLSDNRLRLAIPADVSFDSNSARIRPQFQPMLDRLADSLYRHGQTQVVIIGHTDSTGGPHINDPLSLQRANATRAYLAGRRIRGQRMHTEGRGAREPVATNATAAGRAQNRRVEIYVMEPAPRRR